MELFLKNSRRWCAKDIFPGKIWSSV